MSRFLVPWLVVVMATACAAQSEVFSSDKYAVVLDAGSSNVELKVLAVQVFPIWDILPPVTVIFQQSFAGLQQAIDDPEYMRAYLQRIIDIAKQHVPTQEQQITPIYLLGSSGLKLLPVDSIEKLLTSGDQLLYDKNLNPFLYNPGQTKIIMGPDLAGYTLMSVEVLLSANDSLQSTPKGVLSLSGADLRIAFTVDGLRLLDGQAAIRFMSWPPPYAHTYLNYGTNAVRERVTQAFLENPPMPGERDIVSNPCFLNQSLTVVSVQGRVLEVRGTGQPEMCREIMKTILASSQGLQCAPEPCGIGSVYQPSHEDVTFVATGGELLHLLKQLGFTDADNILRIDQLDEAAVQYCQRPASEGDPDASDPCIYGLYLSTVLTQSFGFDISSKQILLSTNLFYQPDWTIGFILSENPLSGVFSDDQIPA